MNEMNSLQVLLDPQGSCTVLMHVHCLFQVAAHELLRGKWIDHGNVHAVSAFFLAGTSVKRHCCDR